MIDDSQRNMDKKTAIEHAIERLELLTRKHAEAEAKKTPEQKAAEKRQAEARKQASLKEKAEKRSRELNQLYSTWCKRDTWLVCEQALHLLVGRDPTKVMLFEPINEDIWGLAKSCAGHSLRLINPKDKQSLWLVTPSEWVRWLREKGCEVPLELVSILFPIFPIVTPAQKIEPAQQAREQKKRDRLKALKAFVSEIEERARKSKIEFDKQSVPVTKGDFLNVFHSQYPQFEEIPRSTFDHDIAEIGLKFKAGSKFNKNNILTKLFD